MKGFSALPRRSALRSLGGAVGGVAIACGLALVPTASATTAQYCNTSIQGGVMCPTPPSGERHTYHTSDSDNYPWCQYPTTYLYVAYTSSNASNYKYRFTGAACEQVDSFYGNTEYLRPYATHDTSAWSAIVGKATY